ncbi:DUF3054 domain-containing protein [Nocardia huaxiensis]|uniref:DUF3054 domain-containing protein n=1 Tax=Nocardia huaxiensis TaxID=2755382 RepID=A0A7D6ZD65_9NOCA|nr:DUF3054 domain-containing protein [Nocardia huaxiensis]QLY30898.1 DUF3054 domain-containing protein [Nocardia huaxiensis]UFS94409.1 DUF3054 domain-containing protein [Nocardia huaxiensis]
MKKLVPFAVDVVLVVVFCMLGRSSHDEDVLAGLGRTFWPFGLGLLLGWVIAVAVASGREGASAAKRFDGRAAWPTGVIVWVSTLVGGMLLRAVSGQGVAFSFIIVATAFLGLFLVGWRVAMSILRTR